MSNISFFCGSETKNVVKDAAGKAGKSPVPQFSAKFFFRRKIFLVYTHPWKSGATEDTSLSLLPACTKGVKTKETTRKRRCAKEPPANAYAGVATGMGTELPASGNVRLRPGVSGRSPQGAEA